jgi:hypothetical protein
VLEKAETHKMFLNQTRKICSIPSWVIEEANWMSLVTDLRAVVPEGGFDAVICLGNSFAHLPDWHGDQRDHRWDFKEVINGGRLRRCHLLGEQLRSPAGLARRPARPQVGILKAVLNGNSLRVLN